MTVAGEADAIMVRAIVATGMTVRVRSTVMTAVVMHRAAIARVAVVPAHRRAATVSVTIAVRPAGLPKVLAVPPAAAKASLHAVIADDRSPATMAEKHNTRGQRHRPHRTHHPHGESFTTDRERDPGPCPWIFLYPQGLCDLSLLQKPLEVVLVS